MNIHNANESNNLSHLAAVLVRKFDISSLTSLSVGMFDDENDQAIFANLSEKHGTELLKMLKDKRVQQKLPISMMTRCYGCSALKELASLMVCGGCRVNKYCSRDCQVAHWREHSKSCHHYSNQRNVTSKPNSTYETGKKPQTNKSGVTSLKNDELVDHLIQNVDLQELKDYCGRGYVITYCQNKKIPYSDHRWPKIDTLLTAAIAKAQASDDIDR